MDQEGFPKESSNLQRTQKKICTWLSNQFDELFFNTDSSKKEEERKDRSFRGNVMQKTLILLCPRLKSPQQSWTVKNDRSKTESAAALHS